MRLRVRQQIWTLKILCFLFLAFQAFLTMPNQYEFALYKLLERIRETITDWIHQSFN